MEALGPAALHGFLANKDFGIPEASYATAELPLPKVYGDWPVSMDPAVHVKAITDLFQSGASIVNIHSGQVDQSRVIDFYGKNVLPKVKSASMAA